MSQRLTGLDDTRWMRRALHLAEASSIRKTAPNPRVACILVKNGRAIATAIHEQFGSLHAEALAIQKAGKKAAGATAYVTLEPCCHLGKKTPPCAAALIRAGVKRVVIGCRDQNPKVNGKSIRMMKKAGLQVECGVLETEATFLNRFFFHWILKKKPWIILKMASTLDGKITAERRWISNKTALERVQKLRSLVDAILVGKNTVFKDNPRLTVRWHGRTQGKKEQPLRIILDSHLSVHSNYRVFRNGPVLMVTTSKAKPSAILRFKRKGIGVHVAPMDRNGNVRLSSLLSELGRRGIRSVLIEGGGQVVQSFLEQHGVNESYFFVAPILAGAHQVPLYQGKPMRFSNASVHAIGDNALIHVLN